MFVFNTGAIVAVMSRDINGAVVATPTPVRLAKLQDIGVDISIDLKPLHGEGAFAAAIAGGKGKIEVKGKYADFSLSAVGLFLGTAQQTGLRAVANQVAAAVPAASAYTIDVTTLSGYSGTTFVADLGVYSASTGSQFARVASAPAAGQYSVSGAGVYTFASADASAAVLLSFEVTKATGGAFFNIANRPMGTVPRFSLVLQNAYDNKVLSLKLNACVSSSLALPMKNDDWAMSDFNAQAQEDAAGNIGYISIYDKV